MHKDVGSKEVWERLVRHVSGKLKGFYPKVSQTIMEGGGLPDVHVVPTKYNPSTHTFVCLVDLFKLCFFIKQRTFNHKINAHIHLLLHFKINTTYIKEQTTFLGFYNLNNMTCNFTFKTVETQEFETDYHQGDLAWSKLKKYMSFEWI